MAHAARRYARENLRYVSGSVTALPLATGSVDVPTGPNVDLSAVDPLAPRYKEWEERAKQFQTAEAIKAAAEPAIRKSNSRSSMRSSTSRRSMAIS